MTLIPAILIPGAQLRPVIEQGLTAGGFTPCQHSVVQRGQATAVFVVRRRSERQKSLAGSMRRYRFSNPSGAVCVWMSIKDAINQSSTV